MKKAYLKYKNQGCPDEKLDLLIRWINEALILTTPPEMNNPAMTGDELTPPGSNAPIEEAIPETDELALQESIPEDMGAVTPPM